nr:VanZ family protein [Lysinibacillus timonensis]
MKNSIMLSFLYSQIVFLIFLPVWIELTKHLHPIVIAVVWFCISMLFLVGMSWIKKEQILLPRKILHTSIILYSIGLLVLLFFRPNGSSYGSINLVPFDTISFYLTGKVDFLIAFYNLGANIGLFIPFGLYFRYWNTQSSMKRLLFITLCSISIIECLQLMTKRGTLDIDDIILNILSVWLGYLIHPVIQKVFVVK